MFFLSQKQHIALFLRLRTSTSGAPQRFNKRSDSTKNPRQPLLLHDNLSGFFPIRHKMRIQ